MKRSPALDRLIEEVRNDRESGADPNAYNRMHNRHNRSWRPYGPGYVLTEADKRKGRERAERLAKERNMDGKQCPICDTEIEEAQGSECYSCERVVCPRCYSYLTRLCDECSLAR